MATGRALLFKTGRDRSDGAVTRTAAWRAARKIAFSLATPRPGEGGRRFAAQASAATLPHRRNGGDPRHQSHGGWSRAVRDRSVRRATA